MQLQQPIFWIFVILSLFKHGTKEELFHGTQDAQGRAAAFRRPYATPINYIIVDDKLYIHSAPYGYKIECLKRDPKCCFSAIISAEIIPSKITAAFESVVMTGTAVFVEDRAEKQAALEAFVTQKHHGYEEIGFKMIEKMFDKTALLRIDPISTTGKAYKG